MAQSHRSRPSPSRVGSGEQQIRPQSSREDTLPELSLAVCCFWDALHFHVHIPALLLWPSWLRLHASTAVDTGSIPGWGTKTQHAAWTHAAWYGQPTLPNPPKKDLQKEKSAGFHELGQTLGKFHGWRSLVGYSPWGHKKLDRTERLYLHFSIIRLNLLIVHFLLTIFPTKF